MSDYVLVFTGDTSEISCDIYPPIELNQNIKYQIGLLSLDTYNAIANIKTNINDSFTMGLGDLNLPITIPQGCYEVADIKQIMLDSMVEAYVQKIFGTDAPMPQLELFVNPVTNRVRLHSNYNIDFGVPRNFAKILGFLVKKYEANKRYDAPLRVDINPSPTISVECSIASGAIRNGVITHGIYQFVSDVAPGYMLSLSPTNIIYHPINSYIIDNIILKLVDTRGNLIDFSGENITIRLHLKRWG